MDSVSVGIVGCGDISETYLDNAAAFDDFEIMACASRTRASAERRADEFDVTPLDVDELLADPEIDVVLNLTPPVAHADVTLRALEAGKHVYTEKPIATTVADAEGILETAAERGLLVGAAPDTFLGAGLHTCREIIDEGRIGDPVGATVLWLSSGHESWHPNPDLFYEEGGGPLFDIGPYYLTALVFLLGSATGVAGAVTRGFEERTITSEPRYGETIDVEVPTHEAGVVSFEDGVTANVLASFDVQGTTIDSPVFEIYGTEGTLRVPDPNHFEDPVEVSGGGSDDWETVPLVDERATGRGAGLADMARALDSGWDHRTSGALAKHVFEILTGVRTASDEGKYVPLDPPIERPEPVPPMFP